MKLFAGSSALGLALLAGCTSMPGGAGRGEHAAHSPQAAGSPSPTREAQMKAMHEMHERMVAAKTPEERAALMHDHMREHMKAMHGDGAPPCR